MRQKQFHMRRKITEANQNSRKERRLKTHLMINNLKSIKIKMTKGIQQVRKALVEVKDARVVPDIQDIKIMVGGSEEIVKATKMDENNRQIRPKGNDGDTVTRNGMINAGAGTGAGAA